MALDGLAFGEPFVFVLRGTCLLLCCLQSRQHGREVLGDHALQQSRISWFAQHEKIVADRRSRAHPSAFDSRFDLTNIQPQELSPASGLIGR